MKVHEEKLNCSIGHCLLVLPCDFFQSPHPSNKKIKLGLISGLGPVLIYLNYFVLLIICFWGAAVKK